MDKPIIINNSVKRLIVDHLLRVGVPANTLGYQLLKETLELCLEKPELSLRIYDLYHILADKNATQFSRVERNMRTSIEKCFQRLLPEDLYTYFGSYNLAKGKVTNSEFISILLERIRLDLAEKGLNP